MPLKMGLCMFESYISQIFIEYLLKLGTMLIGVVFSKWPVTFPWPQRWDSDTRLGRMGFQYLSSSGCYFLQICQVVSVCCCLGSGSMGRNIKSVADRNALHRTVTIVQFLKSHYLRLYTFYIEYISTCNVWS